MLKFLQRYALTFIVALSFIAFSVFFVCQTIWAQFECWGTIAMCSLLASAAAAVLLR